MRRAGGAAPGVRAERGARPRDAQLRRPAREGEGGRGLLAALLGLGLGLAGQTLPVREVGGGGRGGGGAGPRPEDAEQHRQQEETVQEAEGDDQQHHLEEGDEDVGGRDHEADHAEDGGHGALEDREAEPVQAVPHSVVRATHAVQVVVGDVGSEVNRKP